MATNTKSAKRSEESKAMIHLNLTPSQKTKLNQMAAADRRTLSNFLQVLIEDEFERRSKNGALPQESRVAS